MGSNGEAPVPGSTIEDRVSPRSVLTPPGQPAPIDAAPRDSRAGDLVIDQPLPGQPLSGEPLPGQPEADKPEHAKSAERLPRSEQGTLFADDMRQVDEGVGYRGPTACDVAGITYRQLDYWARTGLVEPTVRPASGSGSQRLYGFRDILVLKVVKRLLDTGVSLQNIRAAVQHLRARGVDDLAQITLMSDGASVYECTSADEVVDLVQGGQGVFGIAVGRVVREVEGTLAELPSERPDGDLEGDHVAHHDDELARRRARRTG
jgi:DNA-binding transcriptional MerR regulator